jgi:hypothetical protein
MLLKRKKGQTKEVNNARCKWLIPAVQLLKRQRSGRWQFKASPDK